MTTTSGIPLHDTPTVEFVSRFQERWKTLENYNAHERALALLFRELYPTNTELEKVLLKVSALNDFYSTNIYDSYAVAKHVCELKIDDRLRSGDQSLVKDVATVTIRDNPKYLYAFATKYCSHHNPNQFPIYDSFVEKMLVYFNQTSPFSKFKKPELRQYERFVEILGDFQRYFDLQECSRRQIDIYLWQAGKDRFPPPPPKNKRRAKAKV